MLNVSDLFKEYSALSTREIELKAVINSVEYLNDSVVSIEIEDSILSEEDLSVGECISSTLMLKLYDTKFIAENAEILIYIRLNGISGYTEWVGLGKFYVGRRSNENGIWEFNCNDALVKANQQFYSELSYPALPIDVLEEIATILNVPIATATHTLVSSATFDVPYKDEDATIMEMLSYLSGALASSCLISKAGELTFRVFDSSIKYGVTKSDYVTFKRTNDLKVITKARAVYNKSGEYTDNGTGSDYETLQYYNPWAVVETGINPYVLSQLNGISYTPCIVDWKGVAYLEVGDFIQVTDKTNMTWNQIESAWKDTTMLWNGESVVTTMIARQKLKLSGGMRAESILSSKSIVKKESVYDGSLTRQIQAVDKSAIKDEIVYNGVSISKANGITIDRSDGKANINLDALNGIKVRNATEDVFYVDTNGNLNVKGNIAMSGGSISWSSVTAPSYGDISGTKPPTDADNTSTVLVDHGFTKIGSDYIYTGTLNADQVNAVGVTAERVNVLEGITKVADVWKSAYGGAITLWNNAGNQIATMSANADSAGILSLGSSDGDTQIQLSIDDYRGSLTLYGPSSESTTISASAISMIDQSGETYIRTLDGESHFLYSMGIGSLSTYAGYLLSVFGDISCETIRADEVYFTSPSSFPTGVPAGTTCYSGGDLWVYNGISWRSTNDPDSPIFNGVLSVNNSSAVTKAQVITDAYRGSLALYGPNSEVASITSKSISVFDQSGTMYINLDENANIFMNPVGIGSNGTYSGYDLSVFGKASFENVRSDTINLAPQGTFPLGAVAGTLIFSSGLLWLYDGSTWRSI